MKQDVLISVIMPTYNQAPYIAAAIESVFSQSYSNIELIVVDNFSSDGTKDIVASFQDSRIQYLRFNNNGIIAASRNHAVKHASGEVLAFLDSDDIWIAKKLEIQIKHLFVEGVICVGTNLAPIGEVMYFKNHLHFSEKEKFRDYRYADIAVANPVVTSSLIVFKKDFEEVRGFDESQEFRFIEDWELWLRISVNGVIRVLSEPLVQYRVTINANRDIRDVSERTLSIFEKHYKQGIVDLNLQRKAVGNCYVRIGKSYLDIGDRKGIYYYVKGLLESGFISQKIKALVGIALLILPQSLRSLIVKVMYRVNSYLFN